MYLNSDLRELIDFIDHHKIGENYCLPTYLDFLADIFFTVGNSVIKSKASIEIELNNPYSTIHLQKVIGYPKDAPSLPKTIHSSKHLFSFSRDTGRFRILPYNDESIFILTIEPMKTVAARLGYMALHGASRLEVEV